MDDDANRYADEHLEQTAVEANGWVVRYRCPNTGARWLEDKLHSERQGGGNTRLTRTSEPN